MNRMVIGNVAKEIILLFLLQLLSQGKLNGQYFGKTKYNTGRINSKSFNRRILFSIILPLMTIHSSQWSNGSGMEPTLFQAAAFILDDCNSINR
ncbi:MAG: hypothetical protein ACXWWC_09755 [Chitinophagaceae bacterium]